jgi:hypothetical protein
MPGPGGLCAALEAAAEAIKTAAPAVAGSQILFLNGAAPSRG